MKKAHDLKHLYQLTEKDLELASELVARAFHDDPLLACYFPDRSTRLEKAKIIFEYELNYTIRYGEVYAISREIKALAAWRPPQNIYMDQEKQIECGVKKVIKNLGRSFLKRVLPIENFVLKKHKEQAPFLHWYLSPIVVDPDFQGRGHASMLLRPMIQRIDKERMPIYLYTNVEKNSRIYKRFGFRVIEKISLPNVDIPQWSMLREVL